MLYDPRWEWQTENKTRRVLIDARALIAQPEKWCPNEWGTFGKSICAAHAVCRANGSELNGGKAQELLQELAGTYLGVFNDGHSHAEVLALFNRAIEWSNAR